MMREREREKDIRAKIFGEKEENMCKISHIKIEDRCCSLLRSGSDQQSLSQSHARLSLHGGFYFPILPFLDIIFVYSCFYGGSWNLPFVTSLTTKQKC